MADYDFKVWLTVEEAAACIPCPGAWLRGIAHRTGERLSVPWGYDLIYRTERNTPKRTPKISGSDWKTEAHRFAFWLESSDLERLSGSQRKS
ncbi:MAG TPA: hypothetical protein VK019_12985 [Pseudomonas sp.]|nr:hypothetical protein [Pseudomonas sp.]